MLTRKLAAEAVGTFFLLATVVGSGIMGDSLSGGNVAVALLANAIATGVMLVVLITALGPISGAHFNPAVTFAFWLRGDITTRPALMFVAVQIPFAILGVWAAHLMFELPILQSSTTLRSGPSQWFSEIIATFGLVATILTVLKARPDYVPAAVGLYITGAYWFTSSTSFANPAVTIARGFSDTFAGIYPGHIPMFILCQLIAAAVAMMACGWLLKDDPKA